ncbi:Vps51/Vps67-domain-containing protein [Tricharina praecox]|uniref:Vps51/Vps67-domain-containing protein n=1 Tax=Tricharina praecox TaxID=43433 RepID=UPI00221F4E8A|nr:Vps51/Vps67-domain-containing protein [Tricharina praecox]XP_051343662.1 Vps51/Vps67-domain-containing protein [Tricharina praecox]KAI5841290.1 Vps51/Vps67-domain-containing protein [Tricharina praecox]KAI5857916.1 Vps51/Vps67-domain-containing protein [Tricharina praecox]
MQSSSPSSSRAPSISITTPITSYPPFPFPNPSTPISSSSSPQHSLDIPRNSSAPKRTRHALRQFYNLSATTGEPLPSLDRDDFSADSYITNILSEKSLRDLLTLENTLINDIRGLDGERKALVYDNYSKLIAATDTIRRMRASMEPLTPTTSTLEPAVSHIEGVSRGLVEGMRAASPRPSTARGKMKGVETAKWALAAPERIRGLVEEGRGDEAKKVLARLRELCDKWEGTAGVDVLRKKGEDAFGKAEEQEEDIS